MFRKKSKREQKPPGRPPRPGGSVNNVAAADNGGRSMSINTNTKPPLGSVRRPSTMRSRSPKPNREPFSDATSKFSSASPSNRSTTSLLATASRGVLESRRRASSCSSSSSDCHPNHQMIVPRTQVLLNHMVDPKVTHQVRRGTGWHCRTATCRPFVRPRAPTAA